MLTAMVLNLALQPTIAEKVKTEINRINPISVVQIVELRNALESFYLTCGFYPTKIEELFRPILKNHCASAGPDAVLPDPDGSRKQRLPLITYEPVLISSAKAGPQSYRVDYQIIGSPRESKH